MTVRYTLAKRKNAYDEFVIRAYVDNRYNEDRTYYTDDWEDAVGTLKAIAKQEGLTVKQQGTGYVADSKKVVDWHRKTNLVELNRAVEQLKSSCAPNLESFRIEQSLIKYGEKIREGYKIICHYPADFSYKQHIKETKKLAEDLKSKFNADEASISSIQNGPDTIYLAYPSQPFTDSKPVNDDFRTQTEQGYNIIATYRSRSGRKYVIVKRPRDYAIGAGYHDNDGTWDQGYYDYPSYEAAKAAIRKVIAKAADVLDSKPDFQGMIKAIKVAKAKTKDNNVEDVPVGYEPEIEERRIITWNNMTKPADLKELVKRYKTAKPEDQMHLVDDIHNRIAEVYRDYQSDLRKIKPDYLTKDDVVKHYKAYNSAIAEINQLFHENNQMF